MPDFITPFRVGGPTIAMLGSSGNNISGTLINQMGDWSAIFSNRSTTIDAYVAYGATSTELSSRVVPVLGVLPSDKSQNVISIPHSTIQSFTFAGPTFFAVLVPPASQAIIDMVSGDGS